MCPRGVDAALEKLRKLKNVHEILPMKYLSMCFKT
jgi:hypothetical protein